MKKLLAGTLLASLSFSALASGRTVSQTIRSIEADRNAKCEYRSSSRAYGFNMYRWHTKNYFCVSNERDFRVGLKVREEVVYEPTGFGTSRPVNYYNGVVTKVTYY